MSSPFFSWGDFSRVREAAIWSKLKPLVAFSRADRGIGGVRHVVPPTWLVSMIPSLQGVRLLKTIASESLPCFVDSCWWAAVSGVAQSWTRLKHVRVPRSSRGREKGLLWSHLILCTVVHTCVVLQIPRDALEAFDAPYGHLIPRIFILRFLTRLLFASIGPSVADELHVLSSCKKV